MDETYYDQASRGLLRLAGGPLLRWLLGMDASAVRFERWLDARMVVPGLPERSGDLIAWVTRQDQGGVPWALPVEFQTAPDARMPGRVMVYGGLIWLAEKPSDLPGDRYSILPVVVHLTGKAVVRREMRWDETHGMEIKPVVWDFCETWAASILAGMEAGAVPRSALPWIPLMRGAGEDGIIDQWREQARLVIDPERLTDLSLTPMFAELAGHAEKWGRAMEGINVRPSKVVEAWMAEGRAEMVVDMLAARFGPVPPEARDGLKRKTADELKRCAEWFAQSGTLDEFRQKAGV